MSMPCFGHVISSRYAFDPAAQHYTRRCARCGDVLETVTLEDINRGDVELPRVVLEHARKKMRR